MKDFKNILFINYGGIGDEILFLSAIQSVKNCYNSAKITLALEPRAKSVKSLTNSIDEVICVDIKAQGFKKYFNIIKFILKTWFKGFDCVISSGKSPFVAIILFLTFIKTKIGYESKFDFLLTHRIKLNENQYAAKMYHDLVAPIVNCEYQNPQITVNGDFSLPNGFKKGEYILIHPGVSKMSIKKNILKCPDVSFWQSVITGLLDKNRQVVLLGTNDDEQNKKPNGDGIFDEKFIWRNLCRFCAASLRSWRGSEYLCHLWPDKREKISTGYFRYCNN